MRRSVALLTIAAAVLFLGFVTSAPVAVAQDGIRIIVPDSSIQHPEDIGVRAHTNYMFVVPDHLEIGDNGAPVAENPLSLSCIYHLVKQTKGCPKTSTILPTGGAKAIAIVDAYDNPSAASDIKTFAAAYGYGTPHFKGKGVVYFAAAGDTDGEVIYPSTSPYVVSAGGTTIVRKSNGYFEEETAWGNGVRGSYPGAGGGPSQYEKRPSYQNVIKSIVGNQRGTPDISSEASNVSYVEIYSADGCGGWCGVGGTSVASPTIAGIINAAGHFKTSTKAELTEAYEDYANATKYKADFNDITIGSNGYKCAVGWEYCTGIGSPKTFKGK